MALDNYSNLKTAIIKWSRRADLGKGGVIDDVITLLETDIYSTGPKALRVKEMQVRSTEATPTADRFLALPDRFLEMRRLSLVLDDFNCDLAPVTPLGLNVLTSQSRPDSYSITSQIEFNRPADQAYVVEMAYYQKPLPLTSANPTNSILTNYPNIYFFGGMAAAFMYAGEEDKAAFWAVKFADTVGEANENDQAGQYGPAQSEYFGEPIP